MRLTVMEVEFSLVQPDLESSHHTRAGDIDGSSQKSIAASKQKVKDCPNGKRYRKGLFSYVAESSRIWESRGKKIFELDILQGTSIQQFQLIQKSSKNSIAAKNADRKSDLRGWGLALATIFQNLNQNTLGLMVYQNSSKYFRFRIKRPVI